MSLRRSLRAGAVPLIAVGMWLVVSLLTGVASGSPPSSPPGQQVRNIATGQGLQVGDVLANLRPDGHGGCIASETEGVEIEDSADLGDTSGEVDVTIDSQCQAVVTSITSYNSQVADASPSPVGGQ